MDPSVRFSPLENPGRLTEKELEKFEVAAVNLLCAEGLPGAEKLDIDRIQRTLDEWAVGIRELTLRNLWRLRDDPEYFQNSRAYFAVYMMLWVLQCTYGVQYNPSKREAVIFRDSRDLFIHGLVPDQDGFRPGGTCASMPVLYAAIGRRLGYPINLVEAGPHVFCRWEPTTPVRCMWDEKPFESKPFNIEAAGEGFSSFPDSYYHKEHRLKPEPLKSMTPREEVAAFCSDRGDVLFFNHRFQEAVPAFAASCAWRHPNVPNRLRYMLTMVCALDGLQIPNRDQKVVEDVRSLCKRHGITFKQFVSPTHTHFRVTSPLIKEAVHV